MKNIRAFFEEADRIKRRLFNCLRNRMWQVDRLDVYCSPDPDGTKYPEYDEYRKEFDKVINSLIHEWKDIEAELREKYKEEPDLDQDIVRWKGFLYEALFYHSCMRQCALFMDAEHLEMQKWTQFDESPPWFSALPLYDIIPVVPHIGGKSIGEPKVPQTKADFLVTYVSDEGPAVPALIDVKSKKPPYNEKFHWQITAAMRKGFIFQLAYPKEGVEYPRSLKEWEIKTPCSKCKRLSNTYSRCSECEEEILPFTIIDARYRLKEMVRKLGYDYKGRF